MRYLKASKKERRIFQEKIKGYEREGRVIVYLEESGFAHDIPVRMAMRLWVNAVMV
ncbi:hypothetical protein [Nitrosomonas communis]|uniref:hypothetical protein n=1 Tax=Nitrosomonas communis TaxID=44574 RepID=UPI0015A5A829|nr:hypothetical protein [Nitrosomonas communis]